MVSENYARATVDGMRQIVCSALNVAIADEVISANPVEKTKSGGLPPRNIAIYGNNQVEQLLKSMKGDKMYIAVFLASNLGLSRGEVSGLKWSSVDLKGKTLTVCELRQYVEEHGIIDGTPKTERRYRTLPLPDYVVDALKAEKKRQLSDQLRLGEAYARNDYVCRCDDGRPPHPGSYSDILGWYTGSATLPHTTFHGLRHSCASVLLANGVPLTIVSAILGHSSTQVTAKVYAHLLDNGKQRAADALQKTYGKK
jgi:integrase